MENKQKSAVIFGCNGQDGSHLSELLLSKDYKVIGVKRRSSTDTTTNITNILNNPSFILIEGDICDASSVNHIISLYKPDECYNLAAQSAVGTSFDQPIYTFEADAVGPLLILDAIRNYSPQTRMYPLL
jgi:GDPmannose 4,6-dehydratase